MRSMNVTKQPKTLEEEANNLPVSTACELTPKHKLFIDRLFTDPDRVQWKAYAAIYPKSNRRSAETQSSRLIKKPELRAYLNELEAKAVESVGVDQSYVKQRLKDIGDRCMTVEPVMIWDTDSKKMVESGEYKFDSGGAIKAAELLGKDLGMFKSDRKVGDGITVNLSLNMGGDRPVQQVSTVIEAESAEDADMKAPRGIPVRADLSQLGSVLSPDPEDNSKAST